MTRTLAVHIAIIVLSSGLVGQSKVQLDIPIHLTSSLNFVPQAFKDEDVGSKGGLSYDIGVGLKFEASTYFTIKGGVHWWNKIFSPRFPAQISLPDGSVISGRIYENGRIRCVGLYVQGFYDGPVGYVGGGFDIALGQSYMADMRAYSNSRQLLGSENGNTTSYLVDDFKNQIDVVLAAALRVPLSDRVSAYPSIQIAIPLAPVFDSGIKTLDPYGGEGNADFQVAVFKFGVDIELDVFRSGTDKKPD